MKTKNSEKLMKYCTMRISNNNVNYSAVFLCSSYTVYIHLKMKQNVGVFVCCSSPAVKC